MWILGKRKSDPTYQARLREAVRARNLSERRLEESSIHLAKVNIIVDQIQEGVRAAL